MNEFNYTDYSEMMRDARRGLEREREQLEEKAADLNNVLKMMDVTDEIMAERDRWQQEAEASARSGRFSSSCGGARTCATTIIRHSLSSSVMII